jgi:hypothetical protein
MYLKHKVPECDFKNIKYDEPVDGAYVLCRGATGRWCPVMFAGPEWLEENDIELVNFEEAEEYIISRNPHDYLEA